MTSIGPTLEGAVGDIGRRIAALSPEKRALLEAQLEKRHIAKPAIDTEGRLSFSQERIYKLAKADPESNFFVRASLFRLPPIDLTVVRAAWASVVERHETFRSELVSGEGRVSLAVRNAISELAVVDDPSGGRLELRIDEAMAAVRTLEPPHFQAIVAVSKGAYVDFILVTHALLCDGPSMAIVRRELLHACQAHAEGRPVELPPIRLQPRDIALHEQRRLRGPHLEQLVERWRHLELALNLSLHTDRPRPAKGLPEVAICKKPSLDGRVLQVADAARRQGVNAAAFWTAALSAVLARFARQSRVVIGVQTSNRNRAEMQAFVGVASGVVPVSLDLANDPPFRELCAQAQSGLLISGAEELPHEKLAQELRVPPGRQHPLFQVLLALRSDLEDRAPDSDAQLHDGADWFCSGSVHYDLAIAVNDLANSPHAELLYDSRLFDEETVCAIAQSLDALIDDAMERPDEPASSLPIFHPAWEPRREGVPQPEFASTIHGLFERRASLNPDNIALLGEEQLSYGELNSRANRLARALQQRGIGQGDTVAVCMRRSADLITAFLAILKTGAIYLPVDPLYPAERLQLMLQDSGARLLLVQPKTADQMDVKCDVVDVTALDTAHLSDNDLGLNLDSHAPAYLMYTSGSTGGPKGVVAPHVGVCHAADAQIQHFGLTDREQILQFASPSFDASIFEMVMAPRCGGVLHLASPEDMMPGPPLVDLLKKRRITVLTMPPSALAAVPPVELPDLRVVISAGETCPAEMVARWASGRRFFNAYGPTEASIWSTVAECFATERPPSIGVPLAHVFVRIVDDRLRFMPVGAPGELLIGGPSVAHGYRNRPELTAERFFEESADGDAADDAATVRWYRTGDLVCRDGHGLLWHMGRIDRQVKVRGFRIEPGEIEACLMEVSGVESAAVEVEQNNLAAYYTGVSAPAPQLVQYEVARRLPPHMVPGSFVMLESMPIGANGKLDRARLRLLAKPRARGTEAPRTPTEVALMEIWKTVLRIEKLSVEDSFFDLGGHSLLAASMMSRAAAALGRELPLNVIFRSRTIAQLAHAFDSVEVTA
jgi:amino acid adenylation domain-containing protein